MPWSTIADFTGITTIQFHNVTATARLINSSVLLVLGIEPQEAGQSQIVMDKVFKLHLPDTQLNLHMKAYSAPLITDHVAASDRSEVHHEIGNLSYQMSKA